MAATQLQEPLQSLKNHHHRRAAARKKVQGNQLFILKVDAAADAGNAVIGAKALVGIN